MDKHFSLMVPEASATAEPLAVTAPFDNAPIATVDTADGEGVDRAFATAHHLFRNRDAWLSKVRRIDILSKAAEITRGRRETLALEAAREGGKPLADSFVEVDRAIDGMRECVDYLRTEAGREIPMGINLASTGRIAFTQDEPIGVVLAFSAFNHPVNLIVHQVCPAVAAGCPFIVKPAEATPLSCWRIVSILHEAGLPPEWGQALMAKDLDVAAAMVADPRVGLFSFIGSGRVGWMLRSKLAPGVRCALEHGGAAAVIVAADADVKEAVPLLAKGGLYHAGQVCVSVQRVFAERAIVRDLATGLAEAASNLLVGDPTHRYSEDLDFFRAEAFETDPLIERLSDVVPLSVQSRSAETLHAVLGGLRVSFLGMWAPLLYPSTPYRGLPSAGICRRLHNLCVEAASVDSRGAAKLSKNRLRRFLGESNSAIVVVHPLESFVVLNDRAFRNDL